MLKVLCTVLQGGGALLQLTCSQGNKILKQELLSENKQYLYNLPNAARCRELTMYPNQIPTVVHLISVQISSPEIPGSSSESVAIDFASETVEFATGTKDDLSQESKSSCSVDLQPETFCLDQNLLNEKESEDEQLSPSLSAVRKFWEGNLGGEPHL